MSTDASEVSLDDLDVVHMPTVRNDRFLYLQSLRGSSLAGTSERTGGNRLRWGLAEMEQNVLHQEVHWSGEGQH